MRVLSLLVLFFVTFVHAASSAAKCQKLTSLAQKAGNQPIRLDTASFNELISDRPRNYTVVVTLTALGAEFGCSICRYVFRDS